MLLIFPLPTADIICYDHILQMKNIQVPDAEHTLRWFKRIWDKTIAYGLTVHVSLTKLQVQEGYNEQKW